MLKRILSVAFVIVVATNGIFTLSVPSFITKCSRKDRENFNKCSIESGNKAIPYIVQGVKEFHVPPLNPLKLEFVQAITLPSLKLNLTDVEVYGLDQGKMIGSNTVPEKGHFSTELFGDNITIVATYHVTGKISVLPIEGTGPAVINFYGGTYNYEFDLQPTADVKKFSKIANDHLSMKFQKITFKLDNLMNGDQMLGAQINQFLNDNWKDLLKEFGPVIGDTLTFIFRTISSGLIENVPMEEFFLD